MQLCLSHITLPGPVRAVPGLFSGFFKQKSYVHSRGPLWPRAAPYEFCLPIRGPWVLRIIQPNHKFADVSNRTGPVAWCDHGNSTDVKFLRALHSAVRARNRTSDKNRTGPVVGCGRGIRVFRRNRNAMLVWHHFHADFCNSAWLKLFAVCFWKLNQMHTCLGCCRVGKWQSM